MQTVLDHGNLRVGCDRSPVQCPALELPGILTEDHIIGLHRGGDLLADRIGILIDRQGSDHIPGKGRALGATDILIGHGVLGGGQRLALPNALKVQAAHGHIDLFRLHVLAVQLPALKGPLVAVHGDFLYHRDLHGDLVLHGVGSLIGRQGTHDFIGHAVVIAVGHAVGDGFISDIYIGPAFDRGICTNCMVLPFIPIPVIPFRMGVTRLIQRNVVRFQISLQRAAMESLAHEDILRASLVVVINRLYSYLLIVIDHGDDVGPAIDGDGFQAVRGVSGILLVAVPGAIVIPTVKFILAGGIGCVVVADIQLAQVDDSALGLFVKFHGLVGRLKVAIAVDHHIDHLLGLPLGPQGDVLLNSIGEVILFIAQIPTVEGIAGLRGSGSRLGRGEAVFHFLVGRNGRTAVRIKGDGILVDVPLRCQGDVLCDGSTKVIRGGVLLVFAQIPEGKGMALERRVVRLGRGEAVFHFLLGRNGRAAVGIKGDGILVDVPLRCQGDVACDRSIKVIRGGVLLVFAQIPERKGIALERRVVRQDSLLAALDVLLIGRRETAVSVEGNGIFLRHMYAALRLELPAVPGPDQRDRNDLLIVLDMFQVLERRVELGHIEVGDIADVAKPVVPVLPRLADEVVYIALAEQIVGVIMLLRIIYDALDLNSHFKLFQLVSRRGFGRGLGGSRLCVLYLDFSFTAVQNPLFILVADHKIQRCLARIVELMRLPFIAVVLCDIRRGLDAYVVCPRLIQSRRFRPVERLALRVVDQVVAFRPAVGLADVLYLNLPDNGFQIVIGGRNGFVRRGRGHRRVVRDVNINGGIARAILPLTELRIPVPCDSLRRRLACLQIMCAVLAAKLFIVCSQILAGIKGHGTDPRIGGLGQNRAVVGNDIAQRISTGNIGDIIKPCVMVIGITPHVDCALGRTGRVDIITEVLYVVYSGFAGRLDLAVTNRYSKRYRIFIPVGIKRLTISLHQPIIIEICKRYVCRASFFCRIIELKRRHICIARETRVYKRKLAVSNYAFL